MGHGTQLAVSALGWSPTPLVWIIHPVSLSLFYFPGSWGTFWRQTRSVSILVSPDLAQVLADRHA